MSIEREAFEQAVTDRWSDKYVRADIHESALKRLRNDADKAGGDV